jgi:GAF domain-containing protein
VSQAPREAHRLDALAATRLLDSDAEAAFDRLTRLASQLLHAPVALVSLIDDRRQFFKSAFGLGEPWSRRRETPLSHSFCQHVVRERSVLRVDDAPSDPRVKGNLAIRDMNVQAYLGTPLMVDDEALGSFCVIDVKPRHWTDAEEKLLRDLGDSVVAEIELRLALRHAHEQRTLTGALLDGLAEGVLAVSPKHEFLVVNAAARSIMGDRRRARLAPTEASCRPRRRRSYVRSRARAPSRWSSRSSRREPRRRPGSRRAVARCATPRGRSSPPCRCSAT